LFASSFSQNLGASLHTMQDFYAHTNWVEMKQVTINKNVAAKRDIGTICVCKCEIMNSNLIYS
jgi:hypothetical protein